MKDQLWFAVHFNDGLIASEWEKRITAEFTKAYSDAGGPRGMALFSFNPIGGSSIYMTPESVPHCPQVLAMLPWSEANSFVLGGPSGWLAGDESLRNH